MSEIRPNLFVIGAAKSGTTSLHNYLKSHPEIYMCEPKEPGYFVPEFPYYPKDRQWYLGLFASATVEKVIGESSTHYTKLPVYRGVPQRIAAFNPHARFIYIMRDPIRRAISHYWHDVRQSLEHRPMFEAISQSVRYTAFSDYGMQLRPYFELFGSHRVYTLTFEELIRDTARTMEKIFAWLGVAESVDSEVLEKLQEQWNAMPTEEHPAVRGRGLLQRFRHSRMWSSLSPFFPQALKQSAKHFAIKSVDPSSLSVDKVVALLRPTHVEKVEALSRMLGRDFPEWDTLFGNRSNVDPGEPRD